MALFSFLKKKKAKAMDLEIPPPPEGLEIPSEERQMRPISDFEPIRPTREMDLKELPAPHEEELHPLMEEHKEEVVLPPAPELEEIPEIEERVKEAEKAATKPEIEEVKEKVEPVQVLRVPTKPIFVSMQDYDSITESANSIKERLKETWDIMNNMVDLRVSEEKELESWRAILEDTQRKLAYVDKLIAEGEG